MSITVMSQTRILPIPSQQTTVDDPALPQCVPLSIVDQTLGGGPLAGCVWLYDFDASGALDVPRLTTSLRHTLAYYPFCGQLEPRAYDPRGDHTQRPGCLQLRWNTPADPGAELVVARSPAQLVDVAPSFAERAQRRGGVWLNESWRKAELFSSTPLASTTAQHEGAPCMSVQLTEFGCGGLAISARWPHTLCDMTAIMHFMRNWAATHRALLAGRDPATAIPPDSRPRFDPELVDGCAAGDVRDRSAPPDEALLSEAAALPRAHWDWWATSEADCPEPMRPLCRIPPQFSSQQAEPFGAPATWLRSWDIAQTAHTALIDFSRNELDAMLAEARTGGQRVSLNDAVLAHISSEVCKARGMREDDEAVHLTLALNLRPRLTPPLPASYIGSPIVNCMVTHSGREWCSLPLPQLAQSVRSALSQFTPSAVRSLLYEMARELTPHRRLMYSVGRHVCSGSWEREAVYELDFGGKGPRLVQYGPGPDMTGVVHTMRPRKEDGDGLSVLLCQRLDVLHRLIRSDGLRRFRPASTT